MRCPATCVGCGNQSVFKDLIAGVCRPQGGGEAECPTKGRFESTVKATFNTP